MTAEIVSAKLAKQQPVVHVEDSPGLQIRVTRKVVFPGQMSLGWRVVFWFPGWLAVVTEAGATLI